MSKIVAIWWAWQWRVVVAVVIANFLFGLMIAFLQPLLAISKESLFIISNIFSFIVTVYASVYFLDYALKKRYKTFRILFLEKSDNLWKEAAKK